VKSQSVVICLISARLCSCFSNSLHWLTFPQRVTYKLCLLTYKCLHGLASPYLARMCVPVSALPGQSQLRAADKHFLSFPRTRTLDSDSQTASILLVGSCIVELAAGIPSGPSAQSQRVPRAPEDSVVCCLTLLCLLFWIVVTAGAFVTFFINCASLKCLFIIIIIIIIIKVCVMVYSIKLHHHVTVYI